MEYIIPAVSANMYDQLIEQETYPAALTALTPTPVRDTRNYKSDY